MKSQLKYFYLINTDQIVTSILNDLNKNTDDPTYFLETVFKHVFNGIPLYIDFIKLDSYNPFYNETTHNPQIRGDCQLLYLALQNNCVLNAFFHELALTSSPIEISAKNEPTIKRTIMDIINGAPCKNYYRSIDVRSQFFNSRKHMFKNMHNIFTTDILLSLDIPDIRSNDMSPLSTLTYLSPAANFLFTENICNKFVDLLNKENNILDYYNKLWNCFLDQQNQYNKVIDKLIFESEMNAIFGFSFFDSVFSFIDKIHISISSEDKTLKDLEGQPFINIISQAANLPLFFNRELFLKFACDAFIYTPQTDYSYFEQSAKYGMYRIESSKAKDQQVLDGLNLMRKFFQVLNSITLPILYSLWEVVIYELQQKNLPLSINNIYEKYLTDNYESIIYSYNLIIDKKVTEWGSLEFTSNHSLNNKSLFDYIQESPYTHDKITDRNLKQIFSMFPIKPSKYSIEVMNQLIRSYCNINSLKEIRFPFFFLTKKELNDYSPLSKFINSSLYDNSCSKMTISKETFLNNYKNILFDYLFTSK